MNRFFSRFCALIAACMLLLTACNETKEPPGSDQFVSPLGDGVSFSVKPREFVGGIWLDLAALTDKSVYSLASLSGDHTFSLVNRTTNEVVQPLRAANGKEYNRTITTAFPVSLEALSEYELHYEVQIFFALQQKLDLTVALPTKSVSSIERRFEVENHWIYLDRAELVNASDDPSIPAFGEIKQVAIYFQIDSPGLRYDLMIKNSSVVQGAAAGTTRQLDETHFVYFHPVKKSESELELLFQNINFQRSFKGVMRF